MPTLQQLTGAVVKKPFGLGSKSEHHAVMLMVGDQRYVLRRQGGNAFQDQELDRLVGKTIQGTGFVTGYTFLMSDWKEVPSAATTHPHR
ncbi:MAG TPA: hypothetical protein VH207_06845 [Chthoniobacterales bacterium]|jgi:hypothetical protein|nr:hypothetical protein [Chthoniobacterales bacterium]